MPNCQQIHTSKLSSEDWVGTVHLREWIRYFALFLPNDESGG